MSTVPLAPDSDDDVAGEGPDDVRGISDLAQRIVASTYLGRPRLQKSLGVVVVVLLVLCLIATVARLNPAPLIPVPVLALGIYAYRRLRASAESHGALLRWFCLYLTSVLLGFWLMSVIARWID
jgi:hypothetical protein